MSYGRRPKGRPRALPCHSVDTEREAEELLVNFCRMGYDGNYYVRADWEDQDLWTAMVSARRQLRLE